KCNWQGPRPITSRALLTTQHHERAQPQKQKGVPSRNRGRPIAAGPNSRIIKRGQRNVCDGESKDAREGESKKVSRTAEPRRQAHQEIACFEPIVRTGEEKNCSDR